MLHNFTLIGSFFLDGFATAAQQLCGQAIGARDRAAFDRAVRLILRWGFGFGVATTLLFVAGGNALIDVMTASPEVRGAARDFMILAALAPVAGVLAYAYDGIYIGRDLGARHAQSHGRGAGDLFCGLVGCSRRSATAGCGGRC